MTIWIAAHVSHFSALVPAAFVSVRRVQDRAFLWVAVGFAVSFLADLFAIVTGGSPAALTWYPVLQFGLLLAAFGGWGLALALPFIAIAQQAVLPGPDLAVTAIGSVGCLYLVDRHSLRGAVIAYCGVASVLWLLMIPARSTPDVFMWLWWPYQLARIAAFGLFVRSAWRSA